MRTNTVNRKTAVADVPLRLSEASAKTARSKPEIDKEPKLKNAGKSERITPVKKFTRNGNPVHKKLNIEKVLEVFRTADVESEAYRKMWLHYGEVMRKAIKHGRMATPERMEALYPIFREIADEADTLI